MIIRELYYFDKETMEPIEDERYDSGDDDSILSLGDTRKTRLTLKDINKARRADDQHQKQYLQSKEQHFGLKKIYHRRN
jgi:hypothetical protein